MTVFIGIDIGGTKIAGGLVTETGQVRQTVRRPTPLTGGGDILEAALDTARELIAQAGEPLAGVGIGTGGQVDCDRGIIVHASSLLPGWTGTPVRAALEAALGVPTFVDNDVNALAVGESRFGAGRGLATVLYLALGTGVGGAVTLRGQVHHGAHWSGGELGGLRLTLNADGGRNSLESFVSGPGLVQTWRELTGRSDGTAPEIAAEAAREPAGAAAQAVTRTGEYLGFGLVSLANVLDPDLIVIGGGLAALDERLLGPARRILQANALPGPASCRVVPASLGPEASVIGAACLAMPPRPAVGTSLSFALLPLDERPVNTRYPQMLGAIGGAEVRLPPQEQRGFLREPANLEAAAGWLREAAQTADAALVSCEFLGSGNLIQSRISHDSAAEILARLRLLADLNPVCPVHAFSLITRVANADESVEEPDYWAAWGTKFYRYAHLSHRAEREGLDTEGTAELAHLKTVLPPEWKADWLTRRLRNHAVSLGLLDMAARGQITSLRLTSDDTSPWGFPSRERDWLRGWPPLLGPALSERVMMHPGADEVGSALVATLLMQRSGEAPRVWPLYSMAGDALLVAPYEDRPVRETVAGQIAACGCHPVAGPEDADIILGVATPSPRRTDYRPEFLDEDRQTRTAAYGDFLTALGEWQAHGVPIALADVAYPNGSDPLLTEMLLAAASPLAPGSLCAYGAWNTAGNTLGVVAAQAACSRRIGAVPERARAQSVFLAHRFLEDWGYQSIARLEARAEAERLWGRREPSPDNSQEQATLCAFIESRLREYLTRLQARGVGTTLYLRPGSVRLPWKRTFEVDFELDAEAG